MASAADSRGVIRRLERVYLALVFALFSLALAFALRYESFNPVLWHFSRPYLLAGLMPLLLLGAAGAALALLPRRRRRPSGRRPPWVLTLAASGLVLAVAAIWSIELPESRFALAAFFLVPALWLPIVARLHAKPELLLAAATWVLAGLALLAVELPSLAQPPQALWGSRRTMQYLFPTEPPFTGRGGRLKGDLDLVMRAPHRPAGARLVTNRDGFRNRRQTAARPAAGVTRVLSLGDSFSTGYGMDQDAFFGALVERYLNASLPRPVEVLNAEVSDPAYGLYYLQRHGMSFEPRIVLYGLAGNDVVQAGQFYGPGRRFRFNSERLLEADPGYSPQSDVGLERYRDFAYGASSPRLKRSRVAPGSAGDKLLSHLMNLRSWHWLLARSSAALDRPQPMFSYLASYESADGRKRLLDGTANLGLFFPAGSDVVEPLWQTFFELLLEADRTAREGGAAFVLILFPQRFQIQPRDWQVTCEQGALASEDFDLTLPNRRILAFCRQHEIVCLDLLQPMKTAAAGRNLYLPFGDMHFNEAGNRLAAELASDFLAAFEALTPPPR